MKAYLLVLFFIFACSVISFSQPAFTSFGEIKVSQSPADDSPPSIAVNNDGAVLVVWMNAVQWLNADLIFNGPNNMKITNGTMPIALPDERWAIIRDTTIGWWTRYFRYYIYQKTTYVDTTSILYKSDEHFEPTVTKGSLLRYSAVDVKSQKINIYTIFETYRYDNDGDFWNTVGDTISFNWNYLKGNVINKINWTDTWNRLYNLGGASLQGIELKDGLAWSVHSKSRNQIYTSYFRRRYPYYGSDPTFYFQVLKIFDFQKDSLLKIIQLDSVKYQTVDLSHKLVLGRNNIAHLINRRVRSDSLGVTNIMLDGNNVSLWKFLVDRVKYTPLKFGLEFLKPDFQLYSTADYEIQYLDDGTFVLAWTRVQMDSTTDVFIARINENMDIIGQPKRINSDATGNQYSPSIAVKGDTIYVSWLDTRNGERHVYMRRFTTDQITDVKNEEAQPTQFAIQEIYPNPFRESTTIKFTLTRPSVTLSQWERVGSKTRYCEVRVYDFLGREVKTLFDGEKESGSDTVQFNANGLQSGVYQVVLQSGKNVARKNVIVMR